MDFGIASRPSLQESPSAEAGTSASVLWSSGGSGLGALYALGGIGDSGRGGSLAASRLSYAGGVVAPDADAAAAAASLAAAAAATFAPALPAPIPQQQQQQQPRPPEADTLDLMSELWYGRRGEWCSETAVGGAARESAFFPFSFRSEKENLNLLLFL